MTPWMALSAVALCWVGCTRPAGEQSRPQAALPAPGEPENQPGEPIAAAVPDRATHHGGGAGDGDDRDRDDGAPDDLVDIARVDDSIAVDMRYATPDNFTGVVLYPVARCLLRRRVAERLARVQARLRKRGLGLKVWDCYRPISIQARLWERVPDPRYVARPVFEDGVAVQGSKHNRGAAVDVTLVDARGEPLEMPTDHDDFTARARFDHPDNPPAARANAALLREHMIAGGFTPIASEWWHFDGPGWPDYPLEDVPID